MRTVPSQGNADDEAVPAHQPIPLHNGPLTGRMVRRASPIGRKATSRKLRGEILRVATSMRKTDPASSRRLASKGRHAS
jgi:hypothetical protein